MRRIGVFSTGVALFIATTGCGDPHGAAVKLDSCVAVHGQIVTSKATRSCTAHFDPGHITTRVDWDGNSLEHFEIRFVSDDGGFHTAEICDTSTSPDGFGMDCTGPASYGDYVHALSGKSGNGPGSRYEYLSVDVLAPMTVTFTSRPATDAARPVGGLVFRLTYKKGGVPPRQAPKPATVIAGTTSSTSSP